MALKGSKKELANEHERLIAESYRGVRSPSSGASVTDDGDVRTASVLFECKARFGERVGQQPVRSTLVSQMEKIADEAYGENREPALALRFWKPGSILADPDGWIDLIVRPLDFDVCRDILAAE